MPLLFRGRRNHHGRPSLKVVFLRRRDTRSKIKKLTYCCCVGKSFCLFSRNIGAVVSHHRLNETFLSAISLSLSLSKDQERQGLASGEKSSVSFQTQVLPTGAIERNIGGTPLIDVTNRVEFKPDKREDLR